VERGEAERALVPIENSIEGSVRPTLDTLAFEAGAVTIVGEHDYRVRVHLIGRRGVSVDGIEAVLSHPQPLAQCARFLRERLPDAERTSTPSTAEAVRMVAAEDRPWAALGSRFAAELYGCQVLDEQVADSEDNVTRFVWLAPSAEPADPDATKTSIVFWGFNDQSPGALVDVLRELADRNINLTKIESRPRRVQLGHYMFFADLDGAEHEPVIREALEGLRTRVETLRVLGSYSAIAAR